jgi:hypothetical protein
MDGIDAPRGIAPRTLGRHLRAPVNSILWWLGCPGQSQLPWGDLPYNDPSLDAAPAIFLAQAINPVKGGGSLPPEGERVSGSRVLAVARMVFWFSLSGTK